MTASLSCSRATPVFSRVAAREEAIVVRCLGEGVYGFSVSNSRAPVYASREWGSEPIQEKKKNIARTPHGNTGQRIRREIFLFIYRCFCQFSSPV